VSDIGTLRDMALWALSEIPIHTTTPTQRKRVVALRDRAIEYILALEAQIVELSAPEPPAHISALPAPGGRE
jgi:hypothetical protein